MTVRVPSKEVFIPIDGDTLEKIAQELREKLPLDANAPGENFFFPKTGDVTPAYFPH